MIIKAIHFETVDSRYWWSYLIQKGQDLYVLTKKDKIYSRNFLCVHDIYVTIRYLQTATALSLFICLHKQNRFTKTDVIFILSNVVKLCNSEKYMRYGSKEIRPEIDIIYLFYYFAKDYIELYKWRIWVVKSKIRLQSFFNIM